MKARCLQHFNLKLLPKTRSDIVGAGEGGCCLARSSFCVFPRFNNLKHFFFLGIYKSATDRKLLLWADLSGDSNLGIGSSIG